MRNLRSFTSIGRLLFVSAVCLLLSVPIGVVCATDLTVVIGNQTKTGASLEAALKGVNLSTVEKLEIKAGDVTTADWKYLRSKTSQMKALKSFIITEAVNSVADIETGVDAVMGKPKDDVESTELVPQSDGSPIAPGCEYVEIHKLAKIGKNSFSEGKGLDVAIFPDLTELGEFALANRNTLRVLIAPKLTSIKVNAFYNCERLALVKLGKVPPVLPKKKLKKPDPDNPGQYKEEDENIASVFMTNKRVAHPVLMPVNDDASALSEAEFATAKTAYLAAEDGKKDDALWYGWNIESFYKIEIADDITGGSIESKPNRFQREGGIVDVYAFPESGKGLSTLKYTKTGSTEPVEIKDELFAMPAADVKLFATFAEKILKGTIHLHYKNSEGIDVDEKHERTDAGNIQDLFKKSKTEDEYIDALKDNDGNVDFTRISKIVISGGSFANSDWGWLKTNRVKLSQLKTFEITKDVESVSSIKDNTDYEGIFYAGDHGALEEVILNKVKSIGSFSFISCTHLVKVEAPDCERIGDNAFDTNQQLVELNAPKVKRLGKQVFNDCRRLKKVAFPALESMAEPNPKVTDPIQLESNAFLDCRSLEEVDLGLVTLIPVHAFNGCLSLMKVNAPKVEVIGNAAFSDSDTISVHPRCISLTTLSFPKLKRIGEYAFRGCKELQQLVLGLEPPTVERGVFDKCPKQDMILFQKEDGSILTEQAEIATVAAKYKAVDDKNTTDEKWYGWTIPTSQLYKLSMDPETVNGTLFIEPIGYAPAGKKVIVTQYPALGYSFGTVTYNGTAVENGTFEMPAAEVKVKAVFSKNTLTVSLNGGAHQTCASLKEAIDASFSDNYKEVKSINVISGSFTTNEWNWLAENVSALYILNEFIISPGVQVADIPSVKNEQVFKGYLSLKSIAKIDIAGLKNVGSSAFQDAKESLTKLNLPDVVSVGANSFYACEKLIDVSVPNLEEVGDAAFGNTLALSSISLPKAKKIGNLAFNAEAAGSLPGQSTLYGVLADVEIPEVEEIGESAFSSCHKLLKIDIPNLKKLGRGAFARCYNLNNVHFDLIDSVSEAAFFVCNKMVDFSFKNAKRIGAKAFTSCIIPEIRDEMFPEVLEIGYDAFKENIRATETVSGLEAVTLSKVVKIDSGAFRLNGALEYANFPALKDLGAKAFMFDGSFTTLIAPKLEKIGRWAFKGCKSLRTLAIGAKVPELVNMSDEDKIKTFDCGGCKGRKLILLDQDGITPLEGDKLTNAIAAFKADGGWGKVSPETWYGWNIITEKVRTVSLSDKIENGTIAGFPNFHATGTPVQIFLRPNNYYAEKPNSLKVYKKGDENTPVTLDKDAAGNIIKKFSMPDYDVELYVEFQKSPFAVRFDEKAIYDGRIECDGIENVKEIPWDTKVTLKLIPDDGFEPVAGSIKVTNEDGKIDVPVDETNSFVMPKFNVKVSAKFQKESKKEIEIAPLENGKVFAQPTSSVSGKEITLTVVPNNGYHLKEGSLKVCKKGEETVTVEVTKKGTDYSFVMPAYNVVVSAIFDEGTPAEDALLAQIKAYPNPFTDVIEIAEASQIQTYALYNIAGVRCLAGNNKDAASTLRIDTKTLPEGSYILQLTVHINGQLHSVVLRLEKSHAVR